MSKVFNFKFMITIKNVSNAFWFNIAFSKNVLVIVMNNINNKNGHT